MFDPKTTGFGCICFGWNCWVIKSPSDGWIWLLLWLWCRWVHLLLTAWLDFKQKKHEINHKFSWWSPSGSSHFCAEKPLYHIMFSLFFLCTFCVCTVCGLLKLLEWSRSFWVKGVSRSPSRLTFGDGWTWRPCHASDACPDGKLAALALFFQHFKHYKRHLSSWKF